MSRRIEVAQAQLLSVQAQVLYRHAEVVSGAYRLRNIDKGVEGGGWRQLTDEEKLADAMGILHRQAQRMHDLSEFIAEEVAKLERMAVRE